MPIGMNHNTYNVNPSEDSVIEIGAIYGSARSSAPAGYLLCDGSAVSRTIYDRLFAAIGTSYGVGNGSTTFNIPDMRGAVPRGAGISSGYTQNVTVTLGTKDNDTVQDHSHSVPVAVSYDVRQTYNISPDLPFRVNEGPSTTSSPNARTANETKMKNIGVNFFIKF